VDRQLWDVPTSRVSGGAARWLENVSGRLPLAVKLPALLSGVLGVVLAIAMFATYRTLRTNVLDRAHDRVQRATRQLSSVGAANIALQQARYTRAANDPVVRHALRGDTAGVSRALSVVSLPTDSGMPVELWTADGRRVAFVGNDLRSTMTVAPGRPELPDRISRVFPDSAGLGSDSMRYGPLYGEDGRVHFWIVMPVRERGRLLGYVTHQRRIVQNANTMRTLRDLAGDSVTLYYRNLDASFWASASGFPLSPHTATDTAEGIAISADGQRLIVNEERVGSTPIVIGMSIPERAIVSRAVGPVRTILVLSLGLFIVGGLAAWAIGRRIATPLSDITRAAEAIATGDFAARVPERGDPEIRRLARSFNHMATEIGESRRALEQQTREARIANNAKSDFLTTMSHELRTPLNAIGGYVELLEMELRGPLTAAQRRDLERIRASQQHLLGLISGVLDLARVESGKVTYDIDNILVEPFLAGLDALIAPQAAAKQVTLDYVPCAPELAARADREKLRQILLNLLSNAIRHTPAGGRVTLSAAPAGTRVQIAVQDTGPGIAVDKHEEIFEPFVQLDRTLAHPREGLGLGLAISRDLAHGMSGDLTVDPDAPTGARFLVTLERGSAENARPLSLSGEMPAVH
jgi:signal transduction histidine kinase